MQFYFKIKKMKIKKNKRYYTACMAMQGLLANSAFANLKTKPSEIAKMAYGMSDELLKQENE